MIEIRAEMAASVWKQVAHVGDRLQAGDTILVLESMKMEIPVETDVEGVLTAVAVDEGQTVAEGDLVATVDDRG